MGQEIDRIAFNPGDYDYFQARLRRETETLAAWSASGRFAQDRYTVGVELECWLVDHGGFPVPINDAYLERLNHALVVPELSRFNVELNSTPQPLIGDALKRLHDELTATWRACQAVAHELDAALLMIGTLPTLADADLCLANISPMNRYFALNEQVMRSRHGKPIAICIEGAETLRSVHRDLMLEAATTSFQIHLQIPATLAPRYYNAALIASAPLLAAGGNSPYLFGKELWHESRIPIFEQAVVDTGRLPRVTFGSGYVDASLSEVFTENLDQYAVLLPARFTDSEERLRYLRLHNGTIWRWNRPLIGFDETGVPHFRIEYRVLPAGPSIVDQVANVALCLGLAGALAGADIAPETKLPFAAARDNFYAVAKSGLAAAVRWTDGRMRTARALLLDELLPTARVGARGFGLEPDTLEPYFDIIERRIASGQTGAAWQTAYIARHGRDFARLTVAYLENQRAGNPVHEWDI